VLTGVEIPAGEHIFGHVLETGWVVQGGGRTLFFNPAMDRDWNIDLSVSNILNHGQHSDIKIPINLLVPNTPGSQPPVLVNPLFSGVSVRELNRTYVNLAFGRDWYLHRPPDAWIHRLRIGLSAGGRLGTEKLELIETTHRTDTIAGLFIGLSTDIEIPCGCCTFLFGMRTEWGYTWSDILQYQPAPGATQGPMGTRGPINNSDLQDVNFLFTAGVRF
jgi:hypothetical protein